MMYSGTARLMHIWCEILPCSIEWNYREILKLQKDLIRSQQTLCEPRVKFNQYHQASKERYGEGKCKVTYDKLLILVSS